MRKIIGSSILATGLVLAVSTAGFAQGGSTATPSTTPAPAASATAPRAAAPAAPVVQQGSVQRPATPANPTGSAHATQPQRPAGVTPSQGSQAQRPAQSGTATTTAPVAPAPTRTN